MTQQELDALQGLCDGATEAPWRAIINREVEQFRVSNSSWGVCETMNDSDAKFIAASRTALPALIAEVRRLQAEIDHNAVFLAVHGVGGYDLANGPDYTAYGDGRIEPNPEWCGPQTTKEDNQ